MPVKNKTVKPLPVVSYTLTVPGELSKRLNGYRLAKSFSSEQEVMRVAIADFLQRQGY